MPETRFLVFDILHISLPKMLQVIYFVTRCIHKLLSLNLSFRTMAISTHEEPYMKYFGRRFGNLSHDSTYEDVKELYDEYAEAYDKVKA